MSQGTLSQDSTRVSRTKRRTPAQQVRLNDQLRPTVDLLHLDHRGWFRTSYFGARYGAHFNLAGPMARLRASAQDGVLRATANTGAIGGTSTIVALADAEHVSNSLELIAKHRSMGPAALTLGVAYPDRPDLVWSSYASADAEARLLTESVVACHLLERLPQLGTAWQLATIALGANLVAEITPVTTPSVEMGGWQSRVAGPFSFETGPSYRTLAGRCTIDDDEIVVRRTNTVGNRSATSGRTDDEMLCWFFDPRLSADELVTYQSLRSSGMAKETAFAACLLCAA